ncbi:MAG TPA: aminotransferase class IV [Candidatus Acidoferrales bacterium]|jgi:branched-chain amino acid aminotransferase|nr:aminotransferase class IV [Candidatus Acidoferrales bacterium]
MIHRLVLHNGKLQSVEEARLSAGQAGLLSGWGLFTTIRVMEGVPFAFERHWQRLHRDSVRTHCPLPFEEEAVRAALGEVLSANQVREGCARIYAIYNQTGFWRSDEMFPQVDLLICSADLPPHKDLVKLGMREHGRHAASPLAGVKVTSWLNNVWNLYEAQQAGFDEVVLLNERGEVAECTAANIFCARNGKVLTPPLSSGCLAGITRGVMLEIGSSAEVSIEERTLFPEDLYKADEVFISSTNRNVVGVSSVNGHGVGTGPRNLMKKLDEVFARYARAYVDVHSAAAGKR